MARKVDATQVAADVPDAIAVRKFAPRYG